MGQGTEAIDERVAGLFPGHTFMSSFDGGRAEIGMNQLLLLRDRLRGEAGLEVSDSELALSVMRLARAGRVVIFGVAKELYFIAGEGSDDILAREKSNRSQPLELEQVRLVEADVIRICRMTSAWHVLEELGGRATSWVYQPALQHELGITSIGVDQLMLILKESGMVVGLFNPRQPGRAKSSRRHVGAYSLGHPFQIERFFEAREALRRRQELKNRTAGHIPYAEFNAARLQRGPHRQAEREALILRILFEATGGTGVCERSAVEVVQEQMPLSRTMILGYLRSLANQGKFKGFRGKKRYEASHPSA